MTLPNGTTADYSYDDAYRLTRILYIKGEVILYDIQYEVDAVGNRTRKTISIPSQPDKVYDYIYDSIYRLVQSNLDGEKQAQHSPA